MSADFRYAEVTDRVRRVRHPFTSLFGTGDQFERSQRGRIAN
jgi:hypothetical protein